MFNFLKNKIKKVFLSDNTNKEENKKSHLKINNNRKKNIVSKSLNEHNLDDQLKLVFPNGKKDLDEGVSFLLKILKSKISLEKAQLIFVRSASIAYLSKNFDEERLVLHLKGYCIELFNDKQISDFYNYLNLRYNR